MKPYIRFITWMVVCPLILSSCGLIGGEATATPEPDGDENFNPVISATGVVVPEQWATLSMSGQGNVVEVLVAEGDQVIAGQPLVRLDGQADAEAKVSAAQYELNDAQQALDSLHENAAVATSLAQQTLANAQKTLDEAKKHRAWKQYRNGSESSIATAQADLILANNALEDAEDAFNSVVDRAENDVDRAAALSALGAARSARDHALANLNYLLAMPNEIDVNQAEADLVSAQAKADAAQDEYDKLKNGPDPDALALAQSRLDQANAQLRAAQEALSDLELQAPFDGVVCNLQARLGEWLAPGKAVLQLGNLDGLRVETTDLNEIDAARIQPGDNAIVTFDALPGISLDGTVQRIAYKSAEGSGVNYTAVILLDEFPEGLRWGMTAFVDIEVDE